MRPPVAPIGPKIFNADFNGNTDGFTYMDDQFGTNQPEYARGRPTNNQLGIWLGGVDDKKINRMSGGWKG